MDVVINAAISAAIREWDEDALNRYLDKHESTFLSFGLFVRGLRSSASTVMPSRYKRCFHNTPDGIRGIISLNVALLRQKLNVL